jgi:hypothetical protein
MDATSPAQAANTDGATPVEGLASTVVLDEAVARGTQPMPRLQVFVSYSVTPLRAA